MLNIWSRFWSIRWLIKGPVIAVVAMVALVAVTPTPDAIEETTSPPFTQTATARTSVTGVTTTIASATPPPSAAGTAVVQGPSAAASSGVTWTVVQIIDGDTVDVRSSTGTTERIRVIGIDTPERGECGFAEAAAALSRLTLNQQVNLVPGARDDRDRYDRLLRYLDVGATDAGLELIKAGLAIARYDSRDGYGRHTREGVYVAADAANGHLCGVTNSTPAIPAAPPPPPAPGGLPIQTFRNCTELNVVYPGGVARVGVTGNMVSGQLRPFGAEPVFDDALYQANTARDGDNDGIACER